MIRPPPVCGPHFELQRRAWNSNRRKLLKRPALGRESTLWEWGVYGGGEHTECLQESEGHRRDSVCEAADPDLPIGIATVRRSPLLGTPRSCRVELALNHKGRTMSTRFFSDWNPLCVPAQVTLENKETGHFYHLLSKGANQSLYALHAAI